MMQIANDEFGAVMPVTARPRICRGYGWAGVGSAYSDVSDEVR